MSKTKSVDLPRMIVKFFRGSDDSQNGFSLIEGVVALSILAILFSLSMPIYLYCRTKIIRHQQLEGALIVAERIYTSYAVQKISTLPYGGGSIDIVDPDILQLQGVNYQAQIEFCPPTISPDEILPDCGSSDPNYRTARISVGRNGSKLFSVIAGFSDKI